MNNDGTIIAVGKEHNATGGGFLVYEYSGGSWSQVGSTIEGNNLFDSLGYSIDINGDGNVVVVGARQGDEVGESTNPGSVSVYYNVSGTWTLVGDTIYGDTDSGQAGYPVRISRDGTRIAIPDKTNPIAAEDREIRVFEIPTSEVSTYGTSRGLVGIGVESPSYELDVSGNTNTTSLIVSSSAIMPISTPSSASDTGTTGQLAVDTDYIYVCTATDTWKRAALSTW